ncbi:DUF4192 domain-containing protein [Actinomadura decatromicini]|uniref:DUF4192 domain-containing protein n=1 Tax=Actinomadura decatromicini TaxID=2604572 RepID=A0A5D3FE63_9ACTN|nr:DUF4192 domain-containing protein [Actinomadura decatromicini]TYK46322.1 DUF4192 domain-containing protein [Actinomadura decatromicini]
MTSLVIRTMLDAIAAVPYLLGFHPSRSLVVIGFEGSMPGSCAARIDLPACEAAARTASVLAGHGFRRALLLGYGPADEVAESAAAMHAALGSAGVTVAEAARVADGRYWPLTPDCPPEGVPYDVSASTIAAEATFAGRVVLADRDELVRSVQPLDGPARAAMRRATQRAELSEPGDDPVALLDRVLARAYVGVLATDDEVARLGVQLTDLRVRDEAWLRLDDEAPAADIVFWRDVLRRVEERYAPAPASLLAYAAYSAGDGGLANVALDRALNADPTYTMAVLLHEVMDAGVPPSKLSKSRTRDRHREAS